MKYANKAWEILQGNVTLPQNKKTVVLGGGTIGCEIMEILAKNNDVTLIEMTDTIGGKVEGMHLGELQLFIENHENVTVLTNSVVKEIFANNVIYENAGSLHKLEADFIISAFGQKSTGKDLVIELEYAGMTVTVIGDAKMAGDFFSATKAAYQAVLAI